MCLSVLQKQGHIVKAKKNKNPEWFAQSESLKHKDLKYFQFFFESVGTCVWTLSFFFFFSNMFIVVNHAAFRNEKFPN